jgi:hypothetical protein
VDELTQRPKVFRVQVSAADAGQPASGHGQAVGRIGGQRVAAVFAPDGDGDDGDDPITMPAIKTATATTTTLAMMASRTSVPRSSFCRSACCESARRAALADSVLVGHGVPSVHDLCILSGWPG